LKFASEYHGLEQLAEEDHALLPRIAGNLRAGRRFVAEYQKHLSVVLGRARIFGMK